MLKLYSGLTIKQTASPFSFTKLQSHNTILSYPKLPLLQNCCLRFFSSQIRRFSLGSFTKEKQKNISGLGSQNEDCRLEVGLKDHLNKQDQDNRDETVENEYKRKELAANLLKLFHERVQSGSKHIIIRNQITGSRESTKERTTVLQNKEKKLSELIETRKKILQRIKELRNKYKASKARIKELEKKTTRTRKPRK
ncbi:hypothetical protein BB560_002177 [Smittium megazygosporum]|uniref:Uncharacterized protein n=1 Tax=Smittium megazygosporum TaxID=133381 RepID=A0A2T9ZFK4_9FUNG|nr:hypothetical protein BB560_002177 [Smittium megazygosporum]